MCEEGKPDPDRCPVHAAMAQKALLTKAFSKKDRTRDGFPFMPTISGGTCSKDQVVKCITKSVSAAGLETHDQDGKLKVTGHWARIGGSRHLWRHGVQYPTISCLARWDSHAILGYLKDAPLANATSEYKTLGQVSKLIAVHDGKANGKKLFGGKVMKQLEALEEKVKEQEADLEALTGRLKITEDAAVPRFVVSDKYQKYHLALSYVDVSKSEWKTHCGWAYGYSVFERRSKIPDDLMDKHKCPNCFAVIHANSDESE